jgi:uncharacterized protein YbjT (DUF2867 family)
MFVVLGGSGHVGSVVAQTLIDQTLPVTVVTHDPRKVMDWEDRGARCAIVDLHDSDALRDVFQSGTRAFLLNPPADVATDTDREEQSTAASIVAALDGCALEKVVLASTFGAKAGDRLGDLSVLYAFEQNALSQRTPVTIQRGAYYFSNWDAQLDEARTGTLTTMLPPRRKIPMVAPEDLGRAAAARLTELWSGDTDLHLVEGPERYSVTDVAETFARVLGHPVRVNALPPEAWEDTYRKLGFSAPAATAYARMTRETAEAEFPDSEDTEKGPTPLDDYIHALVARS